MLTLVIAPPELIALAVEWAGVGLVARSYWISDDRALEANADDGIPLAKARLIGPDISDNEVELAPAMAGEQDLSSLRVVWIRKPGDATGMADAMGRAEASIRRLIPQHGLEPTFSELLVPQTLRDLEIPMPPPDWQQFVVEPMDRPSPGASDSFWDQSTPPRQGLHAALMIGGILGGSNLEQPAPRDAKTDAPWVVHPFTRVVRGADRARQETRAVLSERLSTISAADVAPDRFFAPEQPEDSEYVDTAVEWMLDLDSAALRFRRPEISLERNSQSFVEFLFEVAKFLGWAFTQMFGIQRWTDIALSVRARIARRLEADDYGTTIDASAPSVKGLDLEDWDAREAQAQAQSLPRIVEASRADGRIPSRVVWTALAALVPSLIDGSSGPREWTPRTRFDHTFVLPPQAVIRTESSVLQSAMADTQGAPALQELRGVKRIGERELARARHLAAIGLGEEVALFESPTGRVTKTAEAIIQQARSEATEHRQTLADDLAVGHETVQNDELPFFGRLRASLVADLLLARVAAEQLASTIKTSVPSVLPELRRMLHSGTWLILGSVLVGAALIAFLGRFAKEIDAVFAMMQVAYPTSWMQLVGWVITAVAGVLVVIFARLFYRYHAYNEIGRRRIEYVERRAAAAVFAYDERNRLRNAERMLSRWEDVLSSIGTREVEPRPPFAEVPRDLPDALQVAEPDIDDDELERLVIHDAIEPGWFGDAFTALLSDVLSKDDRESVWLDPGMPGGALARLRDSALEGDFQRAWWEEWEHRAADKVVAKLARDTAMVHPLVARRTDALTAHAFALEITRPMLPEYLPGRDFAELFDARDDGRRLVARARPLTSGFMLTPALTAVDAVLLYRRLGRVDRRDESGDHDESSIGSA